MMERDSIPEEQSAAPAAGEAIINARDIAENILLQFPILDDAVLEAKEYCKREHLSAKASGPIIRSILRISRLAEDKRKMLCRKQAQAEGGDDISIFVDELREKARKDPVWARIYWDAIKHRQSDDEIPQEIRDKAAQVVAAAVDELVQGLAPCCADAVRDLVKRIAGLAEKK